MSRLRSAARRPARGWMSGSRSWPCSRAGDRQAVADIGQIIFEIAVLVGLRLERHAANLAVAGGEAPADRAHAAPFRTIDRHGVENSERRRQHLGANPLAGFLHMAGGAGKIELAAPRIEIALAVLIGFERAGIVGDLDVER